MPTPSVSGTSICTWAMWERFQIGSNRPLAKRRARMFWRRLLAEEVVDAEDLLLGEDLVDRVVELAGADSRSVPNGFSMMIREPSTSPASPINPISPQRRRRRDAQVVQQPGLGPELRAAASTAAGEQRRVGVGDVDVAEAAGRTPRSCSALKSRRPNSSQASQGERAELLVAHLRAGGADDPERRQQPRLAEVAAVRAAACAWRGRPVAPNRTITFGDMFSFRGFARCVSEKTTSGSP